MKNTMPFICISPIHKYHSCHSTTYLPMPNACPKTSIQGLVITELYLFLPTYSFLTFSNPLTLLLPLPLVYSYTVLLHCVPPSLIEWPFLQLWCHTPTLKVYSKYIYSWLTHWLSNANQSQYLIFLDPKLFFSANFSIHFFSLVS